MNSIAAAGLRVWLALLGALALAAAAAPAHADEAELLFDPGAVVEIDLGLAPGARADLEAKPDEYVPAVFTLSAAGQNYGPYEVGFRLKGSAGSFRPLTKKAAFKIKFDEFVDDQTLLGLERLTLNNMVQDPSMVHETLAYDVFRALGVPASRTGYAFVHVNDEPYGVYLNLETLDKISLPRWFASTQHLFEADVPGTDLTPEDASLFEIDRGDDEDISDLEALIAAASDSDGDWSDGIAAVADLEEMTRMWAIERYTGHWDGYTGPEAGLLRPNNYYLHSLDSGVFQMMPWGTDQTWDLAVDFDQAASGLLFNKCLADASCEALYEAALAEVAATVPDLNLDTKAICTAELLDPWQELEEPKRREHNARQIRTGVEETRAFIAQRPLQLAEWLGAAAPTVPDGTGSCSGADPLPLPGHPAVSPRSRDTTLLPSPVRLRFGASSLDGRWLKVRIGVPGAGRLRLTAEVQGRGGTTVCTGRRDVVAAGSPLIVCRLSRPAYRALDRGPLKLEIGITFAAAIGRTYKVIRTIALTPR